MEKETEQLDTAALRELAQACLCMHTRKAARVITQFYETFLPPSGLRMTQFIVLVVVALSEQETVMQLAEKLAMDRSALARSLKSLEDRGLLIIESGSDRRTRLVRLTKPGHQALAQTLPSWRQAQEQLVTQFGEKQARLLLGDLKSVALLNKSIEPLP